MAFIKAGFACAWVISCKSILESMVTWPRRVFLSWLGSKLCGRPRGVGAISGGRRSIWAKSSVVGSVGGSGLADFGPFSYRRGATVLATRVQTVFSSGFKGRPVLDFLVTYPIPMGFGAMALGTNIVQRTGCFITPALSPAIFPGPKNKSPRSGPRIALPVSCTETKTPVFLPL